MTKNKTPAIGDKVMMNGNIFTKVIHVSSGAHSVLVKEDSYHKWEHVFTLRQNGEYVKSGHKKKNQDFRLTFI